MLLTCPHCSAGYDVPDRLLAGAGRRLRCARCARDWQAILPEAPPSPPPADAFIPTSASPPAAASAAPSATPSATLATALPAGPPIARPSPLPALAGLVVSLGLLGSFGWAALHWREEVITLWPPSERAYQAVGLK